MNDGRYEAIELIVKARDDGQSWFDVLFDMFTEGCAGSDVEECTCSLVNMGGTGGTLDQCFNWSETLTAGVTRRMVAEAIVWMAHMLNDEGLYILEDVQAVVEWAQKEIEIDEMFSQEEEE